MLASDSLIEAFNKQVGNELGASHQYVSIASYFASATLNELARFFYRQAEEEREHAMKFVKFVVDAGGTVEIPAVAAARSDFSNAADAVRLALENERTVTEQIYALVRLAEKEKNLIAVRFLDWFVEEQFEEVSTMSALLQVVERAGEDRLLQVEDYVAREGKVIEAPGEEP